VLWARSAGLGQARGPKWQQGENRDEEDGRHEGLRSGFEVVPEHFDSRAESAGRSAQRIGGCRTGIGEKKPCVSQWRGSGAQDCLGIAGRLGLCPHCPGAEPRCRAKPEQATAELGKERPLGIATTYMRLLV